MVSPKVHILWTQGEGIWISIKMKHWILTFSLYKSFAKPWLAECLLDEAAITLEKIKKHWSAGCKQDVKQTRVQWSFRLWPHASSEWKEKTKLSIRGLIRTVGACSLPNAHDILFDLPAPQQSSWTPVQVLLARHRAVIEMFTSPLAVWEGLPINSARSHSWIFGKTAAALGSFPRRVRLSLPRSSLAEN